MGFNFRKSIKIGPARVNLSKSGVGYSVGAGGLRYTKSAKKGKAPEKPGCLGSLFALALVCIALAVIAQYWKILLTIILLGVVIYILCKVLRRKSSTGIEGPSLPAPSDSDNTASQNKIQKPESEVKIYQISEVEHYLDDLLSLMTSNYLYDYKKQELIDTCNVDRPIYKQTVEGCDLELVPDPDNQHDSNAIKVMMGNKKVGYIAAKDCPHLLDVIDKDLAINIHCEISGGKYKMVNEDYDFEKDKSHYTMEYGEDPYGITLYIREKLQ